MMKETKPRPSTDWRTLLEQDANAAKIPKKAFQAVAIPFDRASLRAVKRAAKARNMSMNAYIRRATIAMAEADGACDWDEVMADEPGFGEYGRNMGRAPFRPNGHGFGAWRILVLGKHYADD